jgi:hypothetical protein
VADESRPRDSTTDEPIRHNPFLFFPFFLFSHVVAPHHFAAEMDGWMCVLGLFFFIISSFPDFLFWLFIISPFCAGRMDARNRVL